MKERLASSLLRALALTWRVTVHGTMPPAKCVVVFWHGDMLPIWFTLRCLSPTAMVSSSKDGTLLTQLLLDWKYRVVRGSSSQGGKEALSALTAAAQVGVVAVTPDGPRGPRHQMKPGAVVAAQRAGVPVVPVCARMYSAKVFSRSWDQFAVPLPFSRVAITIGKPLAIPSDADRSDVDGYIAEVAERLMLTGGK